MNKENVFSPFPTLETERLRLRKVCADDTESIFEYASRQEVSRFVTWDMHHSLDDTKAFIDFVLDRYEAGEIAPWGIIEKEGDNQLIGTIDFVSWNMTHRFAEIGYVLSPNHWGKGYIPEAATELLRFGFENMELERIQARTFQENSQSQRVLKKIGMTYEGTMRKWMVSKGKHWDITMYSILKEEFR